MSRQAVAHKEIHRRKVRPLRLPELRPRAKVTEGNVGFRTNMHLVLSQQPLTHQALGGPMGGNVYPALSAVPDVKLTLKEHFS